MSFSKEQELAQKLVVIADTLQPKVSLVGNSLLFTHQGRNASIPLFGSTVVLNRLVSSR